MYWIIWAFAASVLAYWAFLELVETFDEEIFHSMVAQWQGGGWHYSIPIFGEYAMHPIRPRTASLGAMVLYGSLQRVLYGEHSFSSERGVFIVATVLIVWSTANFARARIRFERSKSLYSESAGRGNL